MHQSEQKDALKDMGQVHCGICEINVFVKYNSDTWIMVSSSTETV